MTVNDLSILLADLAHARLATRQVLAPLDPAAAAQQLDGLLADARKQLKR